jgi:hypothetical protein
MRVLIDDERAERKPRHEPDDLTLRIPHGDYFSILDYLKLECAVT